MAESEKVYEVILTEPAELRFFHEILSYLERYFSPERVDEIVEDLFQNISKLSAKPYRGTKELQVRSGGQQLRFVLFCETRVLEIKIIYQVDEATNSVFVVDLFPTRMHPSKMGKAVK